MDKFCDTPSAADSPERCGTTSRRSTLDMSSRPGLVEPIGPSMSMKPRRRMARKRTTKADLSQRLPVQGDIPPALPRGSTAFSVPQLSCPAGPWSRISSQEVSDFCLESTSLSDPRGLPTPGKTSLTAGEPCNSTGCSGCRDGDDGEDCLATGCSTAANQECLRQHSRESRFSGFTVSRPLTRSLASSEMCLHLGVCMLKAACSICSSNGSFFPSKGYLPQSMTKSVAPKPQRSTSGP
mmetsp:Transcript_72653/g.157648  ORF Transcript_72653/g.157648 Transcript_72653/m.157648 type:complete len:238 (+) Transcript_72653:1719-2432(+)